jgi:hypothetical protein
LHPAPVHEQSFRGQLDVQVPPPQSVLQPPPGQATSHIAPLVHVDMQSPPVHAIEHCAFAPQDIVQLPAVQLNVHWLPAAQSAVHGPAVSGQSSVQFWPAGHVHDLPLHPLVAGGTPGGGVTGGGVVPPSLVPASSFPIVKS